MDHQAILKSLEASHSLLRLNILTSASIAAKTESVLRHLSQKQLDETSSATRAVVCMTARARTANKLISIAEIAKRELIARKDGKSTSDKKPVCFQYNVLSSEIDEVPRVPKPRKGEHAKGDIRTDARMQDADDGNAEGEDEDAFETMGPPDTGLKKRKVAILTIILSTESIRQLAAVYG